MYFFAQMAGTVHNLNEGGSVNCKELAACPDIDGSLVGGMG